MPVLTSHHRSYLLNTAKTLAGENRGAPDTLRGRNHAVRSWKKFVGAGKPTEELIWLYVVNEIDKNRKVSGIKTYLASLKKYFRLKDPAVDIRMFDSARIKDTLWQGAARMKKAGHFTKRAVVIKEAQVQSICKSARSFDDKLFAALVVALFYNVARGAEMVHPGHLRSQKSNKLPLYGNVSTSLDRTRIRIMSQKNDQFRPHDLDYNAETCPSWARTTLFEYAAERSNPDRGMAWLPEFFVREDGVVPTTSWLGRKLKGALGVEYTAHGLRAGGATRMALLGYTAFEIQLAGRWTSDAFLSYVSDNEALARALASRGNLPTSRIRHRRH